MLRKRSLALISSVAFVFLVSASVPAQALAIPTLFIKLSASPTLNHPGIVVIDPATHQTIFSLDPDIGRAPASVLKLFSMTTVLSALNADMVFKTTISETSTPGTYFLAGSGDPWITESPFEQQKYQRAFLPTLINKVLELHPDSKSITLDYNNMYALDIAAVQRYFSGRLTINAVKVNSVTEGTTELASIQSPTLGKIVEFTLLYSDNVLADRLARTAAHTLGFGTDAAGIQAAFEKVLTDLGVPHAGMHIYDGNGLSHETRVSAREVADLLVAISDNPKFQPIIAGLPTAGETGTLKTRFVNDAPNAVGLVHAKTGWINTTVSLAGFVTVGDSQYTFAIIANHIHNLESARQAARVTIDQMLGSMAKPQN
jgi:D-alanyl-D-alanine carboxypeptidase/D-alanyl-D-alanine-endopeptidase (penicillin-binding protein 4)